MNNSTGCDNTAEVAMCNFIPPVIISLTKDSVSENVPLGTTVGVFSITGGDDGLDVSTYVYELGDDAAGLFTLFGDTLKTAKVFDFEIEKSYLITLMTHHPDEGKFYDSIFTLTIRNVNEPPTALSLTNVSVSENLPSGTVVGRLSTVDDDIKNDVGDAGDFHTYTLGGVEGGLFSIQDDNELVTSASFDFETTFSYEIDITSRDVGGLMWTQTFTILVTDSNDAPTDITLSNDSINENSDVGTAIGTFITTDQDDPENNDTYIYTLKGTFFDIFQIVDDTLKTKIPLNYEEQSSYEVQITTEDGQGGIYDTTLVISVKDVNDVPIGIDITNNLFPENASMGTLVGVLTTMDEDDTVHTYELGDDASGLFTLFGDTLKTARGFNFEDRSLYTIEITTRDADTSFTQGLTIDITDENDAPTFVIISNHVIAENAEPGVVGFLTALDEDADDQHVYFLSGAGVVPFTISGNRLFSTKRLDYEEQSSYEIFIKARDQSDAESDTIPFIINITNVNEPPTAISLTDTMVSENEPSGTVVGRLITVDDDLKNDVGDASDLHTYTLGGVDSGFFSITDSYELVTSTSFDFEAKSSYEIVITSRDRAGFAWTQTFTISITDSNDSPTNISLSANVIAENQVSDTLIGVLSSTDPDVGDFHTYSLRDDSDTFQIVGNELQSKLPLNYETNSRPVITIISNDGKGGIFEKDFTLEVTNENDAPTAITLSNDTINENKERGTVIGIFNSIDEDDPNMDSVYTYSIENDTFQIVGDTLKTKLSLNYEEKLSYTIQITTDDGQGGIYSGDLIIRVYNINDAPTAITLSNHAIDENVSIGSTIGTLHTVDEDENENHHYVLSGIDDGRSFRIVGNNRLATNDLFDYEKDSSYTISITTQDHGDSLWTQSFTITINNVNEKPTNITLSKNTIEENSDEGTVIGELSTLDPDDPDNNDTYNYSIEGDTTFQIVDNELQVKMPLVYAEKRRHTLSITTQDNGDSTLTEDFIITVENTNDTLPSITLTRDSVAENQDDGAVIGVLSSENGGMNNEYSSDNSLFTISKDTLKTASMFNYEAIPIHYVTITIVDERGRTFSDDFLIKVTNENDTPTDIEINADSIEENIEGRVVIGTVRTVDEDINDEHMYTVNDAAFSFDGNKLITDTPFDYEAKNSYTIFITSNTIDGINEEIKTFTIYVTDVNDAPSAIQLTHTSVAENDSIGTLVGTLSTMDDDLLGGNPRGDTHLYRLVNDNDSESKFFRISGDRLEIDTTFNYEIQSSYDLVLVTTDRAGASLQQSFTITIEDVNDVPTSLSLSNDVVKEKEEAYTVIGILSTEDEDDLNMDSVYTYSVNNDTFRIDNDTLKTNRELDFETQSEYLVAITTVDGRGGTRIEDFPLKVSNVNEPPTAIQLTDTSVAENNPADTLIGILSTTDEDLLNNNKSNDTHSYTLVEDTDKNIFRIQADTLKTKVRFNYEQRESYPISILVTDKEGSTHIERFTIAIQDRNDAPMDISLSKNTVTENEAIGTVIGILSTDDEDDPSMDSLYTYSVNNDTFKIDNDTLKTNRKLDFETLRNYEIEIKVEDGAGGIFPKTFTIDIHNIREKGNRNDFNPPTNILFELLNTLTLDLKTGENIVRLSAIDLDADDSHTFSIDGATNDFFEVVGDTIKLAKSIDQGMYTVYTHQLIITATDEDGKTYRKNLELTFSTKETSVEIGVFENASNGLAKLSKDGDHLVLTSSSRGVAVYEWRDNVWEQMGADIDEIVNRNFNRNFFNQSNQLTPFDFSSDGTRIVLGTLDSIGDTKGSTKVFEWDGDVWTPIGDTLTGKTDDYLGENVAMTHDGHRIVIGSTGKEGGGYVQVFEWEEENWKQVGGNIEANANDYFGMAVAISSNGDRILVGDPSKTGQGKVHVYDYIQGSWVNSATLTDSQSGDDYGVTLSLSSDGNYFAVGTGKAKNDIGRVDIYAWNDPQWEKITLNGADTEQFGHDVDFSKDGTRLVVGAPRYNDFAGRTIVYEKVHDSLWTEKMTIFVGDIRSNESQGSLVSISDGGHRVMTSGRFNQSLKVFDIDTTNILPSGLELSETFIEENEDIHSYIGTFTTMDDDDERHSYTISGKNARSFVIKNDSLLTFEIFDYERKNAYKITVQTEDPKGGKLIRDFVININNINETPTAILLDDSIAVENDGIGTKIGTLNTIDPDINDIHTYTILSDTFQIVGNELQIKIPLNYETQSRYLISITTQDRGDSTFTQEFTILVANEPEGEDSDNRPPTGLTYELLRPLIVSLKPNTSLARLKVIDEDFSDNHRFAIEGKTKDFFKIDNDVLKLAKSIDQGSRTVYDHSLEITVTDKGGEEYTEVITLLFNPDETVKDVEFVDEGIDYADLSENGNHLVTATPQGLSHAISVYEWDGNEWNQIGSDIVEMVNKNEDFSTTRLPIDISADGTRLVLGTLNDSKDHGQVKVYEWDGVSWNTIGNTLNGHLGEQLGESVAITDDGNRIIVGIPGSDIGYAQVFQWNPQRSNTGQGTWVQIGKNIVSDEDGKDIYFGFSVSITSDGERIVVGDYKKEGHGQSDAGVIYTYDLIYGQWELTGKLLGRRREDQYGAIYSLSSEGNRLAVSSNAHNNNTNPGTVTLYDWEADRGSWRRSTTISGTSGERLGSDLSLSKNGNQLVIGDSRYNTSMGRVLFYERNEENNQWKNKQENKSCTCLLEGTNTLDHRGRVLQAGTQGRVVALSSNGKTVMSLGKKDIEILFLNAPPRGLMLSHDSIQENVNIGSEIGILTTLDDDLADNHLRESHTYTVNNDAFKISKDTLQTNMLLSFEEQSTYHLTISTTDRGGGKVEKDFVITIGDINEAPTALELTTHEIKENTPSNTIIGYINVTDEDLTTVSGAEDDITDEHTYELKDNHVPFILSDDTLKATQTFNYETKATYEITIITTDLGGNIFEKTFNIEITDEHEPPTSITLNNDTVKENAVMGTAIGILTTEDEDLINRDSADNDIIDRHTYTFSGDNHALFTLSDDTLKTTQKLNFETQANYEVTIITTDLGGNTFPETFTIKVTDEQEPPTSITLNNDTVKENASIGTCHRNTHYRRRRPYQQGQHR